jgi:transporter family-2 protein
MNWWLSIFAILAGISNPLQSGSNSELLKTIQAPVVAAYLVYLVGALVIACAIPFVGFPARDALGKMGGVAWWALIGGACNAAFLMASLLITKRLGSATFTTLVVVAAVITSLVLDQFGLLGFEPRPINWVRGVGGALAIAGVVLIRFS